MSAKLLLINGFSHEARAVQVKDFIKIHLAKENVCNIWIDPYLERRAVAMFDISLDKDKIICLNGQLTWDDNLITLDIVTTTKSIFVRTYGSCPIETLRTIFLKDNIRTLIGIEEIDEDCYCLSFQEGWDAVLAICAKSWKCMDTTFTVLPYFDCFRVSAEDQYENLLQKSIENKKDSALSCSNHILGGSSNIQLSESERKQSNNSKVISFEETHANSCKDDEKLKECKEKSSSISVKTIIFFPHPFLPKLLILLNIEKALAQCDCTLHESQTTNLDFEITGNKNFLKNVSRLFHREYVKLQDLSIRNDFLALDKIQNDLKKVINSINVSAIFTLKDDLFSLDVVCQDDNTKITFEQFVMSLVTIRQSLSPPSEESNKTKEWIQFVKNFNETNSSVHIFLMQSMVQIVYLSQKVHEVELLLNRIDKKVKALSKTAENEESFCQSTTQRNQFRKSTEIKNPEEEENMAASVSFPSISIDRRVSKAYTYSFQCSFLSKILIALEIHSAIQQSYGLLTVEINDMEISASGPKLEVEELFKAMREQEEIVTEHMYQQKKFKDDIVLPKQLLLIQSSGHFVIFEKKQQVKLFVLVENEYKLTLEEYLTSLILARDCFPLPSEDSNNNKMWKQFKEDFKIAHPMCQIIVTQDLNVILFSLLHDEQVIEILIEDIFGIISVLWNDKSYKDSIIGKTYQNSALNAAPDTQISNLPNDYQHEVKSQAKEWDKELYDDPATCSKVKKDDLVIDKKSDTEDRNKKGNKLSQQFVSIFYWMFEDSSKSTGERIFQRIDKKISDILEEAFLQDNIHHINLDSGPFKKADFTSMTLTVNDETRHLIRIEKYDNPPLVHFPDQWQDMNREKWKIFEILPKEKEYAALSTILGNELNTASNKVEILKIKRLQNERLFKHSIIKGFLMQEPTSSTLLWQKMAPETTQFVCKYGFHPAFSLMLNGETNGKGIYFFKSAGSCLSTKDIKDHTIVCLLYCEVLIGKSVQGKRGLRIPSLDMGGNQVYDSVVYDDSYVVFSNSQAYPFYSVQLRMT